MPLVTIDAVAEELGVSRRTVRRLIRSAALPFRRLGARTLRFDLDALRRWSAAREQRLPNVEPRSVTIGRRPRRRKESDLLARLRGGGEK